MSLRHSRLLGHSGIHTSVVGLGCNNCGRRLDIDGTRRVIDTARECGVTFFDTADIYGRGASEEQLSKLLEGHRDHGVLATRFGIDMGDGRCPRRVGDYIRQAAVLLRAGPRSL